VCDVLTFQRGQVKSLHSYFDSAALLMQLGVLSEMRIPTTA
jgi:hypothetical protein